MLRHGHLLYAGTPADLLASLEGRVWSISTGADGAIPELEGFVETGLYRLADGVQVRRISETRPDSGATPAAPNLEDAYIWLMARDEGARRGAA